MLVDIHTLPLRLRVSASCYTPSYLAEDTKCQLRRTRVALPSLDVLIRGAVRARPALLNDRAAQNHRAGARRSAQSLRVDVHGGLTTVSAFRSFPAAAPPDPSSCARRGRWASADAAGPLHDPTRRAGLGCSSSKSKSARHAVTPGVSVVERAPAAGLHGTCMSTTRCLAMWLS